MKRFIGIPLTWLSGIIEASNSKGPIRENQQAVNEFRKERVFTHSGPEAAGHGCNEFDIVLVIFRGSIWTTIMRRKALRFSALRGLDAASILVILEV